MKTQQFSRLKSYSIIYSRIIFFSLLQELENTRNKLVDAEKLIESQDKLVRDLEEKVHENTFRESTDIKSSISEESAATPVPHTPTPSSAIATYDTPDKPTDKPTGDQLAAMTEECRNLQEQVKKLMQDNTALQVAIFLNYFKARGFIEKERSVREGFKKEKAVVEVEPC